MTPLHMNEYVVTITTEASTTKFTRMAFTAREAAVPILVTLPDVPFGLTVIKASHETQVQHA